MKAEDAGPIAISAMGQAQRQLNAVQAKFKILADFPGIKVDETKPPNNGTADSAMIPGSWSSSSGELSLQRVPAPGVAGNLPMLG